jgi:hypothetical protein
VPYYVFIIVYSLDDDSEDENPPPLAQRPLYESFEPKPTPTPLLPRWVRSTQEATGDLVSDSSYQRQTHS